MADGIFWMSTPVPFVGLKQVNLLAAARRRRLDHGRLQLRRRHAARADRGGLGKAARRQAGQAAGRHAFPSRPRGRLRLDRGKVGAAPAHVARRMAHRQSRGAQPQHRPRAVARHLLSPPRARRGARAAVPAGRRALQRRRDAAEEPQAPARRRFRADRPGQVARHHRRGSFAGARVALLRRAKDPDRRRPDPAEHHHQCQHLACGAGVRRGRRVPATPARRSSTCCIPTR